MFIECDAIFKRVGGMTCPRKSTVSAKKRHFLSLRLTLALLKSVSTLQNMYKGHLRRAWKINNIIEADKDRLLPDS